MLQLFQFISRSRSFIVFVLLEVFCFVFIVNNSNYWGATYFSTASVLSARVLETSSAVTQYTNLRQTNEVLAQENRRLNEILVQIRQATPADAPASYKADSAFAKRFRYVAVAKVIQTTTHSPNNYITIDKGLADGVREGMGVLAPTGVVGKVKFANQHQSLIVSVLHSQFKISAKLTRSGEIGFVQWEGRDATAVLLNDVSRYKKVARGDTAVASELNSVFPAGAMIGRVRSVKVNPDQTFYDIVLALSTDFARLSYVYVVDNKLKTAQETLEQRVDAK